MSVEEAAGRARAVEEADEPPASAPAVDIAGATEELRRGSPLEALQHRDFRLYWTGSFVSQLGSQMRLVAIGVQLWDLTHSFPAMGMLGLVKLLPLLGLSLFGGVIADAFDRRRLLIVTQTIMAISSIVLGLATNMGWASAELIYSISAVTAATVAFDNPARGALVPNLVPRRHLPNALSLNIIVWQVATIVGPMLGGIFVAMGTHGLALIYWIDGVSFTAVIIALYLMRTRPQVEATRNVSFGAVLDGFRFLRRTPIILSTMSLDFVATFFGAASLLLPAVAEQILHLDRQYWGFLYSAPAVGALLAGAIMSWLGNVRRQGWIVIGSVVAYGLATMMFGLSTSVLVTLLALGGTGAADTVSTVMRQTIRQLSTPDELRGRMTSVNMLFYMGGPQLGELEAGLAAAAIGLGPSIALGGLGVLIATGVIGSLVPSLRRYDRDTGET
jgi:MFS family permease